MASTNICVVGLTKIFTDNICKELSSKLDMFYANVSELLEYELMDANKMEEICGKEYLVREELGVIKRVCSFNDTLINIDYINLNNETALKLVKDSSVLIYLRLSKERYKEELLREEQSFNQRLIASDLFEDRDFVCTSIADAVVECGDLDTPDILIKISEKLIENYS